MCGVLHTVHMDDQQHHSAEVPLQHAQATSSKLHAWKPERCSRRSEGRNESAQLSVQGPQHRRQTVCVSRWCRCAAAKLLLLLHPLLFLLILPPLHQLLWDMRHD